MTEYTVIRQSWMESERGWGQKHWGYTLHLTREDMKQANSIYWSHQPDGSAPDWYVAPRNDPEEVLVQQELYDRLVAEKQNPSKNTELGGYGIHHDGRIKKVLEG